MTMMATILMLPSIDEVTDEVDCARGRGAVKKGRNGARYGRGGRGSWGRVHSEGGSCVGPVA